MEYDIPNPFTVPRIKAHTKPIDPISLDTVEKLLKACNALVKRRDGAGREYYSRRPTAKRDRAILLFLLDTGVRVSELCGADICDVDFELGRVLVTGKGNKSRYVYLGRISRQALWKYLDDREPSARSRTNEPLFVSQNGLYRMTRGSVGQLIKRLGNKVGETGLHAHRFRHTFAIQFLRNGGNIFELQQLLGHTTLDMVKHYVRLAQMDLKEAVKKASPADNWKLR